MLVLTRKLQEQIKIGDQVTVTILKIKGSTVRVGISAPRDVRVVRGELPPEGEEAATAGTVAAPADDEVVCTDALPIASDGPAAETVISFRLRRAPEEESVPSAETTTQVSAGHLPLRRIHDRFGAGPLKQLVSSCSALDT